jgi:hypothetical protein
LSDEEQEREAEINARLEELEAANSEFTAEQREQSGVLFVLGYDGELTFFYGLVERGAKAKRNGDEDPAEAQKVEMWCLMKNSCKMISQKWFKCTLGKKTNRRMRFWKILEL